MTLATSSIATVVGADDPTIQALFADAASRWRAAGLNVVGLIAETHGLENRVCRAGYLRDVVSGKAYSIYVETPRAETSCHLDTDGVETACAELLKQIADCDIVVLSKFGKLEAMGEGLAPAFKAAFAAGKPVLTTVSAKHRDAWRAFAPETTFLSADDVTIMMWWQSLRTT